MRNVGHGARFPMATFGNILPPGSIYSGPTVLQLREDFRIAVGLQTDFGFHTKDSCARESGGLSREDFKGVVELATSPFHLGCTDFCASSSPEDQLCKEWFPRLPSVFALVSRTPLAGCKNDGAMLEKFERIHLQVQRLLWDAQARVYLHPPGTDLDALVALLGLVSVNDQPLRLEDGGYTWAGTTFRNGPKLTRLINGCRALEVDENGSHGSHFSH